MPRTAPVPNIPAIPGMNPGVIVAGGGGAGGGKGAGKGKGKGGKNGAGDGSGEEGAEGGGKGAGNCGQGSPGACSNCGHNVSAGDPVDVSTGEVFTNPYQDLFLPGRFNLALVRSYSSARRDLDVGLGFGWCFSLSWTLHVVGRKLHLVTGDGRRLEFPALESNNSSVAYGRYVLVRRDPFYVVYPGSEFAHVFVERESAGDRRQYELRWVRYRNRGELTLRYDRRQLVAVTDTVGRTVDIHREPQGRIGRISVKAPNGARLDAAHFAYDHDGNLVSAVSANGYATRFVYGPRHELTQIAYPNGLDVHFLYDAQLRCVETWGDRADGRDPALDSHQPEYLADGTTPFKGIYHAHLDFVDEGYTEVADSVRVRRFFSTPAGVIDKAVGGVGNVTTRQFDEHQNCVEQVDGNGATWSWEYDELGNVTSATDPLGATLGIQRNLLGQETLLLDQLGVETRIDRDRFGEIVGVSMANGATNRFVLDEYGSVLAATDARGGHHEFALDGHANRVMHRFPNAAEYRFEYDYWGRLIKTYDHDGRERCFTYSAGGQITSATDRLGRTRRFEYGPLDELVREVQADGTTHEFEYGGLAWLHTSRWADGTEVRAAYNAEGLITRLTNEVGASHAYAYDTDLRLASETDYSGRCTTYRYDDLGRVIAVDDRAGKTEYVRDPLGRVVEAVAPDGSALRYAYDARGSLIEASTSEGVHVRFTIDANGWVVREELTVDDRTYSVDAKRDVASERVHVGTSLGHELAAERDREWPDHEALDARRGGD